MAIIEVVDTVAVIGAGMVGVCCALELQRRGVKVTLLDRREPGRETSYGNAGVMSRSSLVPLNNPALREMAWQLLLKRLPSFRYSARYALRQAAWIKSFMSHADERASLATASALDQLIVLSLGEHRRLMHEAGATQRMRDDGWLFLFRNDAAYAASQRSRRTYERHGVDVETLDAEGIQRLEPNLAPIFSRALWIKDAITIDDPGALVDDYARLFVERGGTLRRVEVTSAQPQPGPRRWTLRGDDAFELTVGRVVVALGPWSQDFLKRLNVQVPMAFERGYHVHYAVSAGVTLKRPIYDTGGGYVMSPMQQGLRVCTGVEFNDLDAPKSLAPIEMAEAAARQAMPSMGKALDSAPWLGSRPTLPDSRPVIGEFARLAGLWCAFGHQHIGFSTAAGTAAVLGALMQAQPPPIDALPFRPQRVLR